MGSTPETALLFPVFMSGGEAVEQDHIDAIRARLQGMARKRQFRNLSQAQGVLEDLWVRRKHDTDADWTGILGNSKELLLT